MAESTLIDTQRDTFHCLSERRDRANASNFAKNLNRRSFIWNEARWDTWNRIPCKEALHHPNLPPSGAPQRGSQPTKTLQEQVPDNLQAVDQPLEKASPS